jgi:hypothetical protein
MALEEEGESWACTASGASIIVAVSPEATCHSMWQWKSHTPDKDLVCQWFQVCVGNVVTRRHVSSLGKATYQDCRTENAALCVRLVGQERYHAAWVLKAGLSCCLHRRNLRRLRCGLRLGRRGRASGRGVWYHDQHVLHHWPFGFGIERNVETKEEIVTHFPGSSLFSTISTTSFWARTNAFVLLP